MMPGRTLHRLAGRICIDKTLERVVEPAIADLQKEYAGADRASRRVWVLLAGYFAILKVMAICAVSMSGTSPDERGAIVRTMVWSLTLMVAVTGLLMLPPLSIVEARLSSLFLGALIPQAVPLVIPIGLTFGIAFGILFATGGRGAALRGLLAFAVCVAYWGLIYVGQGFAVYSPLAPSVAGTVPPFMGAWLPNVVISAFAIVVASSRSSRLRGSLKPTP